MASSTRDPITPWEELEGDIEGTADFLFHRVGASVPIKPSATSFDATAPPARPLAVSNRYGLLFVAHSEGFLVAKTKDVIGVAKEIKGIVDEEKEKGVKEKDRAKHPSVMEVSIVDVRIGKVSILALSGDSTALAATVGGTIQLFSVSALYRKEEKPIFSFSLADSSYFRDFRWCRSQDKIFVALSSLGSLYCGNLNGHVDNVMGNVDAVDWSLQGDFLVVARSYILSILSRKFEELQCISLLDLSATDSYSVDSIKWVSSGTIIIGYNSLSKDDIEEGYVIKVISNGECGFEDTSKPIVVSFTDIFHGIDDDALPSDVGPHLFVSYLDRWGLALAAHRKNMDDHVVLLELGVNDKTKGAIALELEQEKFTPRIELQENRELNAILGLDVDRVSLYEKVEHIDGEEVKELCPYCILICVSTEGKLIMFHVTRISDSFFPLQASVEVPSDTIVVKQTSSQVTLPSGSSSNISNFKADDFFSSVGSRNQKHGSSPPHSGVTSKTLGDVHTPAASPDVDAPSGRNAQVSAVGFPMGQPVSDTTSDEGISLASINFAAQSGPGLIRSNTTSSSSSGSGLFGSRELSVANEYKVNSGFVGVNLLQGDSFGWKSPGSSEKYSGSFPSTVSSISTSGLSSAASLTSNFKASGLEHSNAFTRAEKSAGHVVAIRDSVQQGPLGFRRQTVTDQNKARNEMSNAELSGHLYTVNDMVKELDRLLYDIEREDGFADTSVTHLQKPVFALEKGLENLSQETRECKAELAELAPKLQHLQDKMVQISARAVYTEGIVKQASNNEYWDVWNRQKLGPELELKQQQILKADQDLRNQLLQLERHFNVLELNKFGDGGLHRNQRALRGSECAKRIQMAQSLHNTVNSQLVTAKHLSECLSEQMSLLKVTSPQVKRQSVTTELLESIGIEQDANLLRSPDLKRNGFSLDCSKRYLTPTTSRSIGYERTDTNALGTFEPESRRKRYSLHQNLANFKTERVMVKRGPKKKDLVSVDSSSRSKEALYSQVGAASPRKTVTTSSSLEPSTNKSQYDTYSIGREKSSKQTYESLPSPVFRWASPGKVVSESTQVGQSKSTGSSSGKGALPSSSSTSWSSSTAMPPVKLSSIQKMPIGSSGSREKLTSEISVGVPHHSINRFTSVDNTTFNLQSNLSVPTKEIFTSDTPTFPQSDSRNINDKPVRDADSSDKSQVSPPRVAKSPIKPPLSSSTAIFGGSLATSGPSLSANQPGEAVSGSFSVAFPQPLFSSSVFSFPSDKSQGSSSSLSNLANTTPLASPSQLTVGRSTTDTTVSTVSASMSTVSASRTSSGPSASPPGTSSATASTTSSPVIAVKTSAGLSPSQISSALSEAPSRAMVTGPTSGATVATVAAGNTSSSFLSHSHPKLPTSTATSIPSSTVPSGVSSSMSHVNPTNKVKEDVLDFVDSQEDDMDEEAPEASNLPNLGSLSGYGLGSSPSPGVQKSNPFGGSFGPPATANPTVSPFSSMTPTPPGQLFKPASFTPPPIQQVQSSQTMNSSGDSGGFGSFGRPASIGVGQQALGSVLGSFGQSRQFGSNQGIGFASSSGFATGGFAGAASGGGGFAGAAPGGGFAAAAAKGGGGFAAVASSGGGFAAVASSGGGGFSGGAGGVGFGGVASGGGFAGTSGGGGFGSVASSGGFGGAVSGGFGSTGTGKPPAELLMQMRK